MLAHAVTFERAKSPDAASGPRASRLQRVVVEEHPEALAQLLACLHDLATSGESELLQLNNLHAPLLRLADKFDARIVFRTMERQALHGDGHLAALLDRAV